MTYSPACPQCETLGRDLHDTRLQLALAKEELNALKLSLAQTKDEREVKFYPTPPAIGKTPLRYVIADAANDTLKGMVLPLQKGFRVAAAWALALKKGRRTP